MKLVLNFVVIWVLTIFGILGIQSLTLGEKWKLVKIIAFAGVSAIIATMFLTVLVILF